MSDTPLFDLPQVKQPPELTETLSPDQKRTRRQRDLLDVGYHPLTLVLSGPLRLHDDAAPADDPHAAGLRCGDCRFRVLKHYGPRSWPKCDFSGTRQSHGGATDVRKWWPACRDHQPADGAS